MSENAQAKASPHQAQGAINVAPGEKAPTQVTYEDFMNQLTQLKKQIEDVSQKTITTAELDTLKKRIADLEGKLSKKVSEAEEGEQEGEQGEEGSSEEGRKSKKTEESEEATEEGEESEEGKRSEAKKHPSGKGIVAIDEIQKDALKGPDYDWFTKDLLRAHRELTRAPSFK